MLSANRYYREKFGCKLYRLSLDRGFTCPNWDGTLGYGDGAKKDLIAPLWLVDKKRVLNYIHREIPETLG